MFWIFILAVLMTALLWGFLIGQIKRRHVQQLAGRIEQGTQRSLEEFFLFLPVKTLVRGWLTATGLGVLLMGFFNPLYALLIAAVGLIGPPLLYRWFLKRRHRKVQQQLGGFLMMMSNQLRTGVSMAAAITELNQELKGPLGQEISEVIRNVKLGVPLEQALTRWQRRVPVFSVRMVVQALVLGLRSGGQQSALLRQIAENLQQQQQQRDRQEALSAQARMQARVLMCLPIVLFLLIRTIQPQHANVLLNTWPGRIVIMLSGVLMLIGYLMMRRILYSDDQ